ncbi:hypothetical protein [Marinicella gelatinilytica]|uniref:hypothetical protein n=1 Tax=Marinicella gelatinilytica TaxID=2996017 RepID=UPI002260E5BA|nr:hypothetical protein [Marinicella gelatinilytica]MCX7545028.1 hypothetical protein [Marinicella gelatinilytica]
MSTKPSGFSRLKQAASITATGTLGLMGIGSGRAGITTTACYTISVTSAVTSLTTNAYYFCQSTIYASSMLNGTATVSHNSATAAMGISDYSVYGLNISWSGSNNTGSFGSGYTTSLYDAFDGYGGIFVDGAPYNDTDGVVDITGTTLTTDPDVMPNGLEVSSQYYAYTDKRLIRIIHTLHNPTASMITTRAAVGGNLGSDNETYTLNTSNGNSVFDSGDYWVITSDNNVYGGVATSDPIITHVFGGPQGIQPVPLLIPSFGGGGGPQGITANKEKGEKGSRGFGGSDNISFGYDVPVNPGETRYLTFFAAFSLTENEANTSTTDFADPTSLSAAGLLNNLPPGMTDAGANWVGRGTPGGSAQPVPFLSPMGIVTLTGILALMTVRRSRKKVL